MVLVYKLLRTGGRNNEYSVDRTEIWELKQVAEFQLLEDAREYVRVHTQYSADFVRLSEGMGALRQLTFLDEFCFGPRHTCLNTYFVAEAARSVYEKLEACLRDDGISVSRLGDKKWVEC